MNTLEQIANELKNKNNFLVISHASPDGDTVGSATGLIRALRKMGKNANFACSDELPEKYMFMFENLENQEFETETYVTVDIASDALLGDFYGKFEIDIAVDHHKSNSLTAKNIFVDENSATNTMIIFDLIKLLGVEICPKIANSIYTGLVTDTGCFKYSNTSVKSHIMAAELMDIGADCYNINKTFMDTKTFASLKIESEVFSKMEFLANNTVLFAYISQEMLRNTGADSEDTGAIPALIRSIEGVLVGITMKEKEDGVWKASVRATAPADASLICQKLGGGGHRGAGGCSLTTDFEQSKKMLVDASIEHLRVIGL